MIQLPIDSYLQDILNKILQDKPVILTASPGSGKTTRVPARLLRHLQQANVLKKIIVIVPKRLAAVAAADRIATENNWTLGEEVGYQVRFEHLCQKKTQLIFMTEGLFLNKAADPTFWDQVGYIFLDEFHERSAQIDLILGLCFERKILVNDIQLVVMSATLNTEKLKSYFKDYSQIDIQQPPYQLTVSFQKAAQKLTCDSAFYDSLKLTTIQAVKTAQKDILIFLPGSREILKAQTALQPIFPNLKIEIVTGSMSLQQQKKVLNKTDSNRRIILATNIAESSLTLPQIDCVIDSGLEKVVYRERKLGFTKLEITRISKFSATQRAGRAARTSDGLCFKMWHEIDERSFPDQKKPEITTSELWDELLLLSNLGISDFENFSWLEKPNSIKISSAQKQLQKWNLIDTQNRPTNQGQQISKIPLDTVSAILFYLLCANRFSTEACEIFCRLDSIDLSGRPKINPLILTTDLDYLFASPKTEAQKKIERQLAELAKKIPTAGGKLDLTSAGTENDFETTLLEIYSNYFPHRICLKKSKSTGLSASGRGIEFSDSSSLLSENIPNDYFLVFSGAEKNPATTIVQLGLGYSKKQALSVLKKYLTIEQKIDFKIENQKFTKKTIQKFGEFIFAESNPESLSKEELTENWKTYVKQDPALFLNLNPSYQKIIDKIQFIRSKQELLKINISEFEFIEQFAQRLTDYLMNHFSDFNEILHTDFVFHLQEVIPAQILQLLIDLPSVLKLPTGRTVTINYTDPKAPLISAKIQDCFLWHKSPTLLSNQIPVTIELLAPNMRPAQITNDLNNFWQNSYHEVRKELRARYPRHSWPEDVLTLT